MSTSQRPEERGRTRRKERREDLYFEGDKKEEGALRFSAITSRSFHQEEEPEGEERALSIRASQKKKRRHRRGEFIIARKRGKRRGKEPQLHLKSEGREKNG